MLSHYGWLMVYGAVEHPSAQQHHGQVYVNKLDIVDGKTLVPGDRVSFYLYTDDQGLGAEECCLEPPLADYVYPRSGLVADTEEIEETDSEMWHPSRVVDLSLRLSRVFSAALEIDDEESDEDCDIAIRAKAFGNNSGAEQGDSCDESDDSSIGGDCPSHRLATSGNSAGVTWKSKRSSSPDGSTSAGTSDSDGENLSDAFPVATKTLKTLPLTKESAHSHVTVGHKLPLNFRPPPGLSLTAEG